MIGNLFQRSHKGDRITEDGLERKERKMIDADGGKDETDSGHALRAGVLVDQSIRVLDNP